MKEFATFQADRSRATYMSRQRRAHIARLAEMRRRLSPEQVKQALAMKERGLTHGAIAHWFTRNGTPVSYQALKATLERAR